MESAKLSISPSESLNYLTRRQTVQLFKEFLSILERSKSKHIEALNKLSDALPEEYQTYLDLADWWTDEESERLRKEVLQRGNDAIRSIQEEIEKYNISLK